MISPIPIFPRPLGLSYCNFVKYYSDHAHDGTRLGAASAVMSALLTHYFPSPGWSRAKVVLDERPILTLPGDAKSTAYWLVIKQIANSDPIEQASTAKRVMPVLIAITVTDGRFVEKKARTVPAKLAFAPSAVAPDGGLLINNEQYRRGVVIILSEKSRPIRPSFEFYTFNVDGKDCGQCLIPMLVHRRILGEEGSAGMNLEENTISLSLEDVDRVDAVFKQ